MRRNGLARVLVGLLLTGPLPAAGQTDGTPMTIQRLGGAVTLDGLPDEDAWRDVPPLPLTMYAPVHGGEPAQRTEIRVAHDGRHLYLAGRFYDDPAGIRINSLYRDRWNGDDAFAVYVDAFNDNRSAKWFGTTPAGIRFDQLVSDDGATLNGSWDGFWDARTRVTDEGWFAEIRIPFSTLGFDDSGGDAVMGLTVTRLVSRNNERVTFPDIDPRFRFRQPSVARDVVVRGVESGKPVRVTPYVLAGTDRQVVPPEGGGGGWGSERDVPREVGLDVRWSPTGTLTVDATVNTDFAQVEADEQQINLDRFSLFFPEKRRFFQERSEVFDFTTGGGGRLFHSRRIGLTESRAPVPVLGGARVVGRVGEWDVGALAMATEAAEAGGDGTTFGVGRVRRSVLNPYSSAGAMVTARTGAGGDNVTAGVDTDLRLFGDTYLTLKWAGTLHDGAQPGGEDPASFVERSNFVASWARRAARGLAYSLELVRSGESYRPETGFLPRRDFTTANLLANWHVFRDEESRYRQLIPGMLAFSTFRNGDGSLESGRYAVWLQWETKEGGAGWIEPKLFVDDVAAPFSIEGEVDIPAGRHVYGDLQLYWSMPTGRKMRTVVDARAGTFFDGTRAQVIAGPTWNVSPHLELGADYQLTRLRFDDRAGADLHLVRARVRSALNARASGNAFVQYNTATDRLDVNVRLRYNFAEGTDLWLVWDEGLTTHRLTDLDGGLSPRSLTRAFIVKYTHTVGM